MSRIAQGNDVVLLITETDIKMDQHRQPLPGCEGEVGATKEDDFIWAAGVGEMKNHKKPKSLMVSDHDNSS